MQRNQKLSTADTNFQVTIHELLGTAKERASTLRKLIPRYNNEGMNVEKQRFTVNQVRHPVCMTGVKLDSSPFANEEELWIKDRWKQQQSGIGPPG